MAVEYYTKTIENLGLANKETFYKIYHNVTEEETTQALISENNSEITENATNLIDEDIIQIINELDFQFKIEDFIIDELEAIEGIVNVECTIEDQVFDVTITMEAIKESKELYDKLYAREEKLIDIFDHLDIDFSTYLDEV